MKNIAAQKKSYADGNLSWYVAVMHYAVIAAFCLFLVLAIPTNAVGINLVQNPSLEQANPNNANLPLGWSQDKWGNNTALFTYPVDGQDGARGAKVQITAYKKGDAKWWFAHVPVVVGMTYTFSDYYQSDVLSELVIEYKKTNNKFSYVSLGTIPASADWAAISKSFTVPLGVKSATVYHLIQSVGTLTIDNVSVSTGNGDVTPPNPPVDPPVSEGGNLISNPSVETAASTSSVPLDWDTDFWGTNKPVFTYPAAWQEGERGMRVQMTSYTNGDAKWYFKHVPVTPGKTYTFSDYYQSDVPTTVTLEYKSSAGKLSYTDLGALPAAATWTRYSKTFTPPAGTAAVTVLHHISKIGYLNTDNFSLMLPYSGTGTGTTIGTWSTGTGTWSNTGTGTTTGTGTVGTWSGSAWTGGNTGTWTGNNTWTGTTGTGTTATWTVDTTSPTISMTAPLTGSTISGSVRLAATAGDNVGISSVVFFADDIAIGSGATGTGSATSYEMLLDSSKLANGAHAIYAKAVDAANNSGSTATVSVTVNNPVVDTEAPNVSITSPVWWSVVSGTSTLNISATDNVGVVTVHYSITNGTDLIVGQFTAPPYTAIIPADALKSGSHTVTVYAQDAAGNIGNATPLIYTTSYVPPTTLNPNLILNPSLETGTGGIPDHWAKGGWGTNTATFTYPVPGVDGSNAAEVSMSAWTDGDAKWFFADVPVSPWVTYTFTDTYKSTTLSTLTAQYTNSDGTTSFADLVSNLPASADWITATQTMTVPTNAVKVTVFHLINSVGTLDIDNAELRLSSGSGTTTSSGVTSTGSLDANAFPTGLVSLTFDDGWGSQYDSAFPILNASGIKGSFYIITNEMKNSVNANRIENPSFEASSSPSVPSGWTGSAVGTNNAVFTYPVSGVSGGKATKVDITSYTDGDAKWKFDDTTVVNGEIYNFTDQYMANVPTKVTVVYTLANNTTQTFDLGTVPASSNWSIASFTFTPPTNTETLTVYHRLVSSGTLTTDDYHLDIAQDYMNLSQIKDIYNAGHEVSAHTRTHPFLTQLTQTQATQEISGARQDMIGAGFVPSDTFVYPYGEYNPSVIQITKDAGYIGARSVDHGYNTKATNKYALMIQEVNSSTTAEQWESWTQTAMKNHTWLILMFHQIDHQNDLYGAAPEELQKYVNYLVVNGIPTVTMQQGIKMMNP